MFYCNVTWKTTYIENMLHRNVIYIIQHLDYIAIILLKLTHSFTYISCHHIFFGNILQINGRKRTG
jgi:hypothetical protein